MRAFHISHIICKLDNDWVQIHNEYFDDGCHYRKERCNECGKALFHRYTDYKSGSNIHTLNEWKFHINHSDNFEELKNAALQNFNNDRVSLFAYEESRTVYLVAK